MWMMGLSVASASPWPALDVPPVVGQGDDVGAVIIAIDDYFAVPDVPGAERNGYAWYEWFVQGRGVAPERVAYLAGREATAESILAAADRVGRSVGSGGQAWLVFIGHGGAVGDEAAVLGVDVQPNLDSLEARGVTRTALGEALSAGGAVPVMILDSCFSGLTRTGAPLVPGTQPVVPVYATSLAGTTLSAGTGDELAGALPGDERPAFSYLLLGALQGWGDADQDGTVTSEEAVQFAGGALLATLTGRTQRPSHQGDSLPLAPAGSLPPPDLTAVVAARTAEEPAPPVAGPTVSRRPASPAAPPTKKVCKNTVEQVDSFTGDTRWVARGGAHLLTYGADEGELTLFLSGLDAPKLTLSWSEVSPPGAVRVQFVLDDDTLVDLPSVASDAFEPRIGAWPFRFAVDRAVAEALASSPATHHRWSMGGAEKITGSLPAGEGKALQRSFSCQLQNLPSDR